jgi:hypothetical protein
MSLPHSPLRFFLGLEPHILIRCFPVISQPIPKPKIAREKKKIDRRIVISKGDIAFNKVYGLKKLSIHINKKEIFE